MRRFGKVIPALITMVCIVLAWPNSATAYSLKTVFSVAGSGDGAQPKSGDLLIGDGVGYGTTSSGGAYGLGSLYSIAPASGAVTILHSFSGGTDGSVPIGGLTLGDGVIYGTTSDYADGNVQNSFGTVFSYTPSTNVLKTIHRFKVADGGAFPAGDMVELGGKLYGVTLDKNYNTSCPKPGTCILSEVPGTVFEINPVTAAFSTVHVFGFDYSSTTTDGAIPIGGLAVSGTMLYGATYGAGANETGTIFQIDTKTGKESLVLSFGSFASGTGKVPLGFPDGRPALVGNTLYGTVEFGGAYSCGAIYSINLAHPVATLLHNFKMSNDGCNPTTGLTVLNDLNKGPTLFGTTTTKIFSILTNDSGEKIYPLPSGSSQPSAVTIDGVVIYGTTMIGGPVGSGTVFKLSLPSALPITTLHAFTGPTSPQNPAISRSLSSNLVGVTNEGGAHGAGTIFATEFGRFEPSAEPVKTLHTFSGGSDGQFPNGPLVASGGTLYGTTSAGGASGAGTLFSIDQQGGKKTLLHAFTGGTDGGSPSNLFLVGKVIYGTTSAGGGNGVGTIFSVSVTGGSFTTVHHFVAGSTKNGGTGDGPPGGLIEVAGNLYGLTGGVFNNDTSAVSCGSVYRLTPGVTGPSGYKTLYSFGDGDTYDCGRGGGFPVGTLVADGGNLYGVTSLFGKNYTGTLFVINPYDGSETTLVDFPSGFAVKTGLTVIGGGVFVGTTSGGGASGYGGVFKYSQGLSTSVSLIYSFPGGADGGVPMSPLFVGGGEYLYGMTSEGGAHGAGTVFALVP